MPPQEPPRLEIELSAGPVSYVDSGGPGPVVLFVHGLLMDSSLWDSVVDDLSVDHRCVVPTLPLGAHRTPMRADADLTPEGLTRLLVELIDQLRLDEPTVVGIDTGGLLVQLLVRDQPGRVGRLVLASCDAFDNVPPGPTGKALVAFGRLPQPLFTMIVQQLRLRPVRRLPIAFGWLTRRGDAATRRWLEPLLRQREVRRDTVRVLRGIAAHRDVLRDAARWLSTFDRPSLVVWARRDRVMPPEHGRRLANLLPQGRLVEVDDSDTLIALDRPDVLAGALRTFLSVRSGSAHA